MQIDQYGFVATSQWFCRRELEPYRIKRLGEDTYVCFHAEDPRPIHKIHKDEATGEITVTWAYGAWAEADQLAYLPINQTREV